MNGTAPLLEIRETVARARIFFFLKTDAWFHLGSGLASDRERPKKRDADADSCAEVADVARDEKGRPCIPGASLKGMLAARARELGIVSSERDRLFGREDSDGGGNAGLLSADYAFWESGPGFPGNREGWDEARQTAFVTRTAIDRATGAAAHEKLFNLEAVPPGVSFLGSLRLYRPEAADFSALAMLLSSPSPIFLGAHKSNGFGKVSLELRDCEIVTEAALKRWALAPQQPLPWQAVAWPSAAQTAQPASRPTCRIPFKLVFDGLALLGAQTTKTGHTAPTERAESLTDGTGRVRYPASSFRGVLRGHGETLLKRKESTLARLFPGRPSPADPTGKAVEVLHGDDPKTLSLPAAIWGAGGWSAPVRIEDLRAAERPEYQEIQRTALDPTLGTAKDGQLFSQNYVRRSVLEGVLEFDERKWREAGVEDLAKALWARILNDLQNAPREFSFGKGSKNGFGKARLVVTDEDARERLRRWTESPLFSEVFANDDASPERIRIGLKLDFTGPFFVPDLQKEPKTVLAASSFRGTLRHRAERYLRSLYGEEAAPLPQSEKNKDENREIESLALSEKIFGATGWASPWKFEDFVGSVEQTPLSQPRISNDRLTGGNLTLFSSKFVWKPHFSGCVEIDLGAWRRAKVEERGIEVLAFLLDELQSGNLCFGRLSGVGYGRCLASFDIQASDEIKTALEGALKKGFGQAVKIRLNPAAPRSEPRPVPVDEGKAYGFIPATPPQPKHGAIPATFDDLAKAAGHDRWHENRLSGLIRCKLTTENAVLIAGEGKEIKKAFGIMLDGKLEVFISGSSLRGMLSQMIESVTNSAFRVLAKERYRYVWKLSKELLPWNKERELITPAELIFGAVSTEKRPRIEAWKGRLSFSWANLLSPLPPVENKRQATLATPWPKGLRNTALYLENNRAKGRKYYTHRSPTANFSSSGLTTACCVPHGSVFSFEIRFEDLNVLELGAVLYALKPCESFRHKLGLGKGQNWGRAKIEIAEIQACCLSGSLGDEEIDPVSVFLSQDAYALQRNALEALGRNPPFVADARTQSAPPSAPPRVAPAASASRDALKGKIVECRLCEYEKPKQRPRFEFVVDERGNDPKTVGYLLKPADFERKFGKPAVGSVHRFVIKNHNTSGTYELDLPSS